MILGVDKEGLLAIAQLKLKIDTIDPRRFYSSIKPHNTTKDEFSHLPLSRQRKYQLHEAGSAVRYLC